MSHTLILVEGSQDIEILKEHINSINDTKIISFDVLSHKTLNKLKISHNVIEDYFSLEDQYEMENKSIELCTSWYKDENFRTLEYEGLNLGSLLEQEGVVYFFRHLKRILGIKRVLEKEKPKKMIGAYLSNFINSVCENRIETILLQSENISFLYFDSFEIPINIGHKIKSIKISREKFMKIKAFAEATTNVFFQLKPDLQDIVNKKPILLLDFNPVAYADLLKALSQNQILLLNQRKPAVFNLQSLQIVKSSNCKIIQLDDFINSDISSQISKEVHDFDKQFNTIWLKKEILEKTFSIENISFWNAIREEFIFSAKRRFHESIKRIILLKRLFESVNFKCILEWSHLGIEDKPVLHIANKKKIPIIFLQHGLEVFNTKTEKYIPFLTILPSNCAKEAVWGNIMKNYLLEHKINSDEIIETGSPRHDIMFKRKINRKKTNIILITMNPFLHLNFAGNDTRSFDYLEECIKKTIDAINKISNKKIIIKLHPSKAYYDVKPFIREIDPSIPIYQNQDIMDLIESCDAMISLNYTTALLDAMILNKPTMLIVTEKQNQEEEPMFKRNASLCISNINEIESSLNDIIFNEKIRNDLIRKGHEFVNDYCTNHGTASEYLASILKNY